MPSPTSRTRPTSRTSWRAPRCLSSSRITEAISSGLNFIAAPRQELISDGVDPGPDRAVVDLVADLDDHAAQEVRVEPRDDDRVESGRLPDRLPERLGLLLRERDHRPDGDADPLGPFVEQVAVRGRDVPHQAQPVLGVQYVQEMEHQVADLAPERVFQERDFGGPL